MPDTPAAPPRAPRQERGRRRVDEILDAAEALIVEVGPAAASIQDIARRAGASVGSIYHFFPTKDAILDALRARHHDEGVAVQTEIRQALEAAAGLPLREFVERLIHPLAEFVERRPAAFAVDTGITKHKDHDELDAALREALIVALRTRTPHSTPEEIACRADVMGAIGDGIAMLMVRVPAEARRGIVGEMSRALYGYLLAFEPEPLTPGAGSPASPSGR